MIYLDNAATTMRKPQAVIDATVAALQSMGNSGRGAHESTLQTSRAIFDARARAAALFGCPRADHVVFTSNSTEALNIALMGLVEEGDRVVSTDLEHNSVLRPLYRLRDERGADVAFVPADSSGRIDYADFERLVTPGTKLVVCTHASNLTGDAVDVARVAEIAHAAGALMVVDGSQSAGAFPVDMEQMGIDVFCFTGHKSLLGPQGTGGLCIREGVQIKPWKVGGSGIKTYLESHPAEYPTRLEAGTMNGHGLAGLAASLAYVQQTGVETIHAHEEKLMRRFYDGVKDIPGVKVYGDFTADYRAPIVSVSVGDYDSGEVSDELSLTYGIATRSGGHCAPRLHRAMGTEEKGLVRFSFGWYNTEEDVDAAIAAVREIAED